MPMYQARPLETVPLCLQFVPKCSPSVLMIASHICATLRAILF